MNPRKTRFFNRGFGGIGGGGGAPAEAQYIHTISPHWNSAGSSDLDLKWNYLSGAAGTDTDMYGDNGSFAPALSEASLLIQQPDSQTPIGNDHWVSWRLFGAWDGAGDYAGCAVRFNQAIESYYGFRHDVDDYELYKFVAGAKTVLKSGAVTPSGLGVDVWRLQVEGTSLTVYRNDVEFESATDGDVSSGDGIGICTESFAINNRIGEIRYGDLPYDTTDHVYIWNDWRTNYRGDVLGTQVIDTCAGWISPANADNQSAVTGSGHLNTPEPHYMTWDMAEKVKFSRMRTRGNVGAASKHDWTDVDIEVSDDNVAWESVVTGLEFDNKNANGWKYTPAFGPATGRYFRFTINATEEASNHAETEEIEIWSGDEADIWWLTDTVTHFDCWGSWRMKGVLSYWNSRANANSCETGSNRRLNQAVGVVPWSFAQGAMFDQTNFFDTQWIADGSGQTIICRFSGAVSTKPVLGDAGPGGIQIVAVTGTTFLCSNQTTDTPLITVADTTAEFTICMAGASLYIDGVLDSTMPSYTPAVGSVNVFLGGVSGVGGGATMVAAAIYDRVLDATEVAAITTKMQAL